jgi:phosphatidylglycerophosphate synthase
MSPTSRRWQILVRLRPDAPLVAGLPCAIRSAIRAGLELKPERIVVAGATEHDLHRWKLPLSAPGVQIFGEDSVSPAFDPRAPVLVFDADSFPDDGAAVAAVTQFADGGTGRAFGRRIVVAVSNAAELGEGSPNERYQRAFSLMVAEAETAGFHDAGSEKSRELSETLLYSRLAKETDGYLAKFDRRISIAVTKLLIPTTVTPNQVTAASLILGLWGAWELASASPARQFLGACILWFCAILDGTDGELARLKHLQTRWGGAFDLAVDHLAHLATFIALPIGASRLHHHTDWRLPGLLLVTGFLACGYSVWRFVLQVPENHRGPESLVVERIASRDYVYLILACAAIGRLDWFIWAAAFGSHVFWIMLWTVANRRPNCGGLPVPHRRSGSS